MGADSIPPRPLEHSPLGTRQTMHDPTLVAPFREPERIAPATGEERQCWPLFRSPFSARGRAAQRPVVGTGRRISE